MTKHIALTLFTAAAAALVVGCSSGGSQKAATPSGHPSHQPAATTSAPSSTAPATTRPKPSTKPSTKPTESMTPCGVTGAMCPVKPGDSSSGYGVYTMTDSSEGTFTVTLTAAGDPASKGALITEGERHTCGISTPAVYVNAVIDAATATDTDSTPSEVEIVSSGRKYTLITMDDYVTDIGANADDAGQPIPGNKCGSDDIDAPDPSDSTPFYNEAIDYGNSAGQVLPGTKEPETFVLIGSSTLPVPAGVYADGERMDKRQS